MDLVAFAQIGNLEQIMTACDIHVPRLRGLRLMKNEVPLSSEEIKEEAERDVALDMSFNWDRFRRQKYWGRDKEGYYIIWNKLHGKARKRAKFDVKKARRRYEEQYGIWNGYCGRDDVLYIHSRLGGNNWLYYDGPELEKQPWFLCKVDDAFDSTYCDIYAKIRRADDE